MKESRLSNVRRNGHFVLLAVQQGLHSTDCTMRTTPWQIWSARDPSVVEFVRANASTITISLKDNRNTHRYSAVVVCEVLGSHVHGKTLSNKQMLTFDSVRSSKREEELHNDEDTVV